FQSVAIHAGRLVSDSLPAGAFDDTGDIRYQRPSRDSYLASDFLRRLDLEPRVGKQDGAAGGEQQVAAIACETGEVTKIGTSRDQQYVDVPLRQARRRRLAAQRAFALGH